MGFYYYQMHSLQLTPIETGLCVYEVDDPTQQTDSQDESTRLLKRVAELEGVIREVRIIFLHLDYIFKAMLSVA